MRFARREFLGLSIAAGVVPVSAHAAAIDPWARARKLFLLDPKLVHLSSFLLASHPTPVREAIERYRRELDENPVRFVNDNHDRLDRRVRAAAAKYLGVAADELVLTDSTTMGLGLVY